MATWLRVFSIDITTPRYHWARHLSMIQRWASGLTLLPTVVGMHTCVFPTLQLRANAPHVRSRASQRCRAWLGGFGRSSLR
eukprot:COSAG01_NODE_10077_length_2255_cov_1.871521_2_plen_81_part_00